MIRQQLELVSSLFLAGVLVMLSYDVLIASRDKKGKRLLTRIAEDLFFWQISAVIVFYIIYRINEGNIRGYGIAAYFSGMALFQYAIGRKLTKYLKKKFSCCRMKLHVWFKRFDKYI